MKRILLVEDDLSLINGLSFAVKKQGYQLDVAHTSSDDINNIYKRGKISYEFRKIFSNKDKIYIFYCDKGAMSLVICEKMSGLGYICKTVVGGFEAYKGMCVIN